MSRWVLPALLVALFVVLAVNAAGIWSAQSELRDAASAREQIEPTRIGGSLEMRRTTWVDDKGLSHEVVTRADEVGEGQTLEGLHSERVNKAIAQWPPKAAGDVDGK